MHICTMNTSVIGNILSMGLLWALEEMLWHLYLRLIGISQIEYVGHETRWLGNLYLMTQIFTLVHLQMMNES